MPIAIIGIAGRMPKSRNLDEFWKNLEEGRDCISEIPGDRWDWRDYYGDPKSEPNKTKAKWGGFMDDVFRFDSRFFNISPRECELMDPQHRIFMETVWEAIENAGYRASTLSGSNTGLFVGVGGNDYLELMNKNRIDVQAYTSTGNMHSVLTNRISYLLDLHGPSEPINTACSSSLVAIHRAVESLRTNECSMAIAGGVNVILTPTWHISFSKAGMLSEDGRCKTFDRKANGYVRGEGVGALLLKPLSRAEEDGDHIYGIIKGSSINHGGNANSLTAPNPNAQAKLIINALKSANVKPNTISYIEAHGTGTSLGDPIEINGLKKAFSEFTLNKENNGKRNYCGIGSAKTNIGHLETAAGIAGILKVVLSLKNGKIPKNVHFDTLNPYIDLNNSPFYVVDKTQTWERLTDNDGKEIPRRAGISSFGFGGVNAHIIIEEYTSNQTDYSCNDPEKYPITISAKTKEQLKQYVTSLSKFLTEHCGKARIEDIAYTMQTGRDSFNERMVVFAGSSQELKNSLSKLVTEGLSDDTILQGSEADQTIDLFKEKEGQDFVNQIIRKRDVITLGKLWISGVDINWELLYQVKPKRIPLPGCPFTGDIIKINPTAANHDRTVSQLHPLVKRNISTLNQQCFLNEFSGDEFFLKDHKIKGRKILPASAYLEMIQVAGALSLEGKNIVMEAVSWERPFWANAEKNLHISLLPQDRNQIHVKVANNLKQGSSLHAQCFIHLVGVQVGIGNPEKLDIQNLISRSTDRYSKERIYESFSNQGIDYGESFRVIEKIHLISETESLAEYNLSELKDRSSYVFHPSVLDGAFQSVIGVSGTENERLFLPKSLEKVWAYGDINTSAYVYVKKIPSSKDDQLCSDITLVRDNGEVLCKLSNFTLQEIKIKKVSQANAKVYKNRPLDRDTNRKRIEDALAKDLKNIIGGLQKYDPLKIDVRKDLANYGFDSISFADLTTRINNKYRIDLSPSTFFDHNTIEAVVPYLLSEFPDTFKSFYHEDEKVKYDNSIETSAQVEVDFTPNDVSPEKEKKVDSLRFVTGNYSGSQYLNQPVAIVGIAGVYPGSPDLNAYWRNLVDGKVLITEVPKERWNWEDHYGDPVEENKTDSKWGGFIQGAKDFDPSFFGISEVEAIMMDPQQRKLLEVVWHTIEDAGYKVSELSERTVGLFVGVMNNDFHEVLKERNVPIDSFYGPGYMKSFLANRISYQLNLQGPSEVIDTACSSSTVSIHRAIKSLHYNECEIAIAGGVNLMFTPSVTIGSSKTGILTGDPVIRTFDEDARGYLRGEGIGTVMLKPLEKARSDGDNIHAIILSSAVSHGGKSNSLTTISLNGQFNTIKRAYEEAGISPDTVSYVELQGPASAYGDPIEIDALKKSFRHLSGTLGEENLKGNYCGIGTLKPNIGHLESASGIAALTKVILSMKHGVLPKIMNLNKVNPMIKLKESPFYLIRNNQDWMQTGENDQMPVSRRASINSYGIGGTNAHLIVEEYREAVNETDTDFDKGPFLIVLSAKDRKQLTVYVKELFEYLKHTNIPLQRIEYTLQNGREEMDVRLAVYAHTRKELIEKCQVYLTSKSGVFEKDIFEHMVSEDELILDADIYEEAVEKALDKKDRLKLAKLWVKGARIEWRRLYKGTVMKASAPGYPFKKKEYWIEKKADEKQREVRPSEAIVFTTRDTEHSNTGNGIHRALSEMITRYTGVEIHEKDYSKEFTALGIESRMIVQIKFELEKEFGMKLPMSTFFECNTINALILYIQHKMEDVKMDSGTIGMPESGNLNNMEKLVRSFTNDEIDFIYDQIKDSSPNIYN